MKPLVHLALTALLLSALLTGCAWPGSYSNVSTAADGTVNGTNQRTMEDVTEDVLPQLTPEQDKSSN